MVQWSAKRRIDPTPNWSHTHPNSVLPIRDHRLTINYRNPSKNPHYSDPSLMMMTDDDVDSMNLRIGEDASNGPIFMIMVRDLHTHTHNKRGEVE